MFPRGRGSGHGRGEIRLPWRADSVTSRELSWPVDRMRAGPRAVRRRRQRRQWFAAGEYEGGDEGGDEGGEPAGAGGEEVDHDDPAGSFDAADGGDHAGQDVEAGQPEDQEDPEEVAVG